MPRENRRVRTTGLSQAAKKKQNTRQFVDKFEQVCTIGDTFSNGETVAKFPVGKFTYKTQHISIVAPDEIAGKTRVKGGKHIVKTEFIPDYIANIKTLINGRKQREMDTPLFAMFNAFEGYDTNDGTLIEAYGGPFQFKNIYEEDAYALGTADLESYRMVFKMTADWVNGMELRIASEYNQASKVHAHFRSRSMLRKQYHAAGEHTMQELDINSDIGAIHIIGENILRAELIVDGTTVFDGDLMQIEALNDLYGNDVSALGNNATFDFLRAKEITKGLKSLESDAQRKRQANIKIKLEVSDATELLFIVDEIGRLQDQG